MLNRFLNKQSSPDAKKNSAEVIYRNLSDFFFEKVNFISFPFSQSLNTDGSEVTSTTNFIGTSRITDTSQGKLIRADRESRLRLNFYCKNPTYASGYIISPLVRNNFTSLNSITQANLEASESYCGVKFVAGEIFGVAKNAGELERLFPTNARLSFDITQKLEIKYHVNSFELFINNEYIGSFAVDTNTSINSDAIVLPFYNPMRTTNASFPVVLTAENIQFIQQI